MKIIFIENFYSEIKKEKFFDDNDERTVFFAKGVIETVKKLGWAPDIVHAHGWFSSLLPLYIRTAYKDNPIFSDLKIIFSLYDDGFTESFKNGFTEKMVTKGLTKEELKHYSDGTFVSLMKGAIDRSDALIQGSENLNPEILEYAKASGKPMLDYIDDENYYVAYNEFYDKIIGED